MRRSVQLTLAALAALSIASLDAPRATAQTIVNVERLQPGDARGWHGSIGGSFKVTGGNEDVLDIKTGFSVGHRWDAHWLRLFTGVDYRSREGTRTTDNRFAHLRYTYVLSESWQTFHFTQLQQNQALLLRERVLLGSGVRRTLYRSPRSSFDLGTGAMYERELLDAERIGPDDVVQARAWRMANMAVASRQFRDNLRFVGVAYLQPDLADLADYRALADASLLVGLGPMVDLTLRFEWRHDSRPPSTIGPTDYVFETGIVVSLR
jgi:hypothetical protein